MNQLRGEISLQVKNAEYKLRLSTNSICNLEEMLNSSVSDILKNNWNLTKVRAVIYCACLEFQKDMTLERAGEIIDILGFDQSFETASKVLMAGLPVKETPEKKTDETDKPDQTKE